MTTTRQKTRGDTAKHYDIVHMFYVKWCNCHLKVDCDNLKLYTINFKAAINITRQMVIANETPKKLKLNHKKNN